MFAKPYKLKSNNTLKNSEKKQLVQRMKDEFPSVSDEDLKVLVPAKSTSICMRLVLHGGDTVGVFVVEGVPVLLDTAEGLVPTVCALWKVPDLVPTITIHSPVLPKIMGGAPLYVPGVEVPAGGAGGGFPSFSRGAVVAARTQDNAAAALVGRALLASADMLFRATGVCLETVQVVGDLLCREPKFARIERPSLGPPAPAPPAPPAAPVDALARHVAQLNMEPLIKEPVVKEEWPALGRPAPAPAPAQSPAPHQPALIPEVAGRAGGADTPSDDDDAADTDSPPAEGAAAGAVPAPADMDALLRWSLLSFLKLQAKSVELPLKTNLLYKNHLIPMCPPDRSLDVKKSTYKKMGKFLEAMQQEGLVEVREVEKGVSALTALNVEHEGVRAHRVPAAVRAELRARAQPQDGGEREYAPPQVREMLCVTAHVAPVFPHLKKGAALTGAEVRAGLTEYVRARGLHAAEQRGAVVLDAPLAKIANMREQLKNTRDKNVVKACTEESKPLLTIGAFLTVVNDLLFTKECIKWEALMVAVTGRMTAATEMRFADGAARLAKSKLEPVRMHVATRSGNKKVTLVSNLEAFGFALGALAHACQLGVGASCGVTRAPGAKSDQLMLQGDQTHFVAKLLVEKYGLPKKYLEGADKALNKKK